MMNYSFYFYTYIFLIAATILLLIGIEIALALSFFINNDLYKKYENLFLSMWEITGTSIVFFVVQYEALLPSLLIPIAYSFYPLIFIILFLFIFRNIGIGFFEGKSINKEYSKRDILIYLFGTLIMAILLVSILSTAITGYGIKIINGNIVWGLSIIFNYFTLLLLLSTILFVLGILGYIFNVKKFKIYGLMGYLLVLLDIYLYENTIPYLFIFPLIVLLILTFVNLKDLVQRILFIIVHYLNAIILATLLFPYIFGTININSLLSQSMPLLSAEFIISIIIIIVVIGIYYFEIKTILS
ncbi:putative membrane protein [Candidatus Nanobsidianus stetteri]|uniref:Putative membrane protein n=1 Tax=Nanobsidianus stetteri TaxID=1294122 RepID=R1G2A8_NANST|nr:putative membrane protein [Candidatus Nanobsidianus stetteri]